MRFIWLVLSLTAFASLIALGQEPKPVPEPKPSQAPPQTPVVEAKRLIEQDPFDRITLDAANQNAVLDVLPLALPNRRVPEKPAPGSKLKLKLLSEPTKDYEVVWSAIRQIDFFEEMVLREADQLVASGKFDEAYEYFDFLVKNYPNTRNLKPSLQAFLYQDAANLFRQQRYDAALVVLEELYAQAPQYRNLAAVLATVSDKLIGEDVAQGKFESARTLIDRLAKQYGAEQTTTVDKWRGQLIQMAAAKRDEARQHLTAGRAREARQVGNEMLRIWPAVEGGTALFEQIQREHPIVVVAVAQPALVDDLRRLDNYAARRSGRLTQRMLFEFLGQGSEGGQYACSLGTLESSEDGLQLILRLRQPGVRDDLPSATGYELSRGLLSLAVPESADYLPAWSQLMSRVSVEDVFQVRVDLQRPHILPDAVLQVSLESCVGDPSAGSSGLYVVAERTESETHFVANPRFPPSPTAPRAEILERHYRDPQAAIQALRSGEIDVIDRLFPLDAYRLSTDKSFIVSRYDVPSVHMLVPNPRNPYLANRTFRRALVYGINRELILQRDVLRGVNLSGCRVVSGPFPAGDSENVALGYAYDETIDPYPYEPRLSATLTILAEQELAAAAEKRKEPPPKRSSLLIGHPAEEIPRAVCASIVRQLGAVGIGCKLKEFPPGVFDDPQNECDLLYVEIAMWEPLVDAGRLLGPGGIAASDNPYINLALRRLAVAKNWREARQRLREMHLMTYHEVSVIPLWQMFEQFARRATVEGVATRPHLLYQGVEQWQSVPRLPQG